MTYYALIAGIIISSFFNNKTIEIRKKNINTSFVYIVFWGIVLVALCGLRRIDIGRDTMMYSVTYDIMQHRTSWQDVLNHYSYLEFGFYFLEYMVSRFFNYQIFLVICSVISIVPVMVVIYRYSENKMMSLMLFVTFPYYTFCMSGLRQACALGLIMIAYIAVQEKKLMRFLLFVILASIFHTSAMLFIPVYWLNKIPNKKFIVPVSVGLMIFTYVYRGVLWQIASQFARQQYEENDAGGLMMYIFMILTVVLGFIYGNYFKEEHKEHRVLLYMQIIAAALWPITAVNAAIARMYYYYHIFFILYVPAVAGSIKDKTIRLIVTAGYYFVALYFIETQILPEVYKFSPYHFFWN